MRVLGIETATWSASVGLSRDGRAIAERSLATRGNHAVSLPELIGATLAEAGWRLADLEGVAVSIGPGSFTGLRVGLASAKGLAFALGIPLVGVRTLVALAAAAGVADGLVCPILDARKAEVYAALVEFRAGRGEIAQPEVAIALDRWLEVVGDRACTFLGDGVPLLLSRRRPQWTLLSPAVRGPSGSQVARLGEERLTAGEADSAADLEPFYCRPSEAELRQR